MTRTARLERLYTMNRAHPVLTCYLAGCLKCAAYYRVLLTPGP